MNAWLAQDGTGWALTDDRSNAQLKEALTAEPSLPAAIDHLLSVELIKDVEERGAWPEDVVRRDREDEERSSASASPPNNNAEGERPIVSLPTPYLNKLTSSHAASSPLSRSASAISTSSAARKSRTKRQQIKVPLVDTLQRSSPLPSPGPSRTQSPVGVRPAKPPSGPSDNAWGTMASLAAHLSDLLPHPSSYFVSYLHSPRYFSPYSAVRASLVDLPGAPTVEADLRSRQVLEEMYGVALGDATLQVQADLELCTKVVGGDVATVMDLMDLLAEISQWGGDDDAYLDRYDQYSKEAIVQSPQVPVLPTLPAVAINATSDDDSSVGIRDRRTAKDRFVDRRTGPKHTILANGVEASQPFRTELMMRPGSSARTKVVIPDRVIPGSKAGSTSTTNPTATDNFGMTSSAFAPAMGRSKSNPGKQVHPLNWRHVNHEHERQRRLGAMHPYASHIPSYARGALPHNATPGSLHAATLSASGELTVEECLRRAQAEREKRESSVRLAGRHFKSSSSKATQGSIAGSYAVRARESADLARQWELKAARLVVMRRLEQTGHTIDLHNLTIMEAKEVVLEAAERWWEKEKTRAAYAGTPDGGAGAMQRAKTFVPARQLTVITGVGRHSAGKMGVLGPAVANTLEEHGWRVERGERSRGYIVVHGRNR